MPPLVSKTHADGSGSTTGPLNNRMGRERERKKEQDGEWGGHTHSRFMNLPSDSVDS